MAGLSEPGSLEATTTTVPPRFACWFGVGAAAVLAPAAAVVAAEAAVVVVAALVVVAAVVTELAVVTAAVVVLAETVVAAAVVTGLEAGVGVLSPQAASNEVKTRSKAKIERNLVTISYPPLRVTFQFYRMIQVCGKASCELAWLVYLL